MELRQIKRPKLYREMNPPNRQGVATPGPLRFASGKNKGRIVPTRPNPVRSLLCKRCKLPFVRGLAPVALVLGFDPKTGEAQDEYVHRSCPSNVAEVAKMIADNIAAAREAENRRRALDRTRRGPQGFLR